MKLFRNLIGSLTFKLPVCFIIKIKKKKKKQKSVKKGKMTEKEQARLILGTIYEKLQFSRSPSTT